MTTLQQAIDHYHYGVSHDIFSEPVTTYANLAIAAMEKQIPKKPIHIHEEHSEHLWRRDESGNIDVWAFEEGYCNGPVCTRCHHSECVHCNEDWETDPVCDCVVDKDICPICRKDLDYWNKGNYCQNCGQALDWSD